jgi:hypothetical protein
MARVRGKDVKLELPIEDYPTMLFFPHLGPPGILAGRPRDLADMREFWIYRMNLNPHSFAKYRIESMASAVMDTQRFSQMLAKIAHAYAVACYGVQGFKPLLLEHILGDGAFPFHFVGGTDGDPPRRGALHEISDEVCKVNGQSYLLVRLRLFASLGAPTFVIVAGLPSV